MSRVLVKIGSAIRENDNTIADEKLAFLAVGAWQWTLRLEEVWRGKPRDSLDLTLVDVRENYPALPIAPFKVNVASHSWDAGDDSWWLDSVCA